MCPRPTKALVLESLSTVRSLGQGKAGQLAINILSIVSEEVVIGPMALPYSPLLPFSCVPYLVVSCEH